MAAMAEALLAALAADEQRCSLKKRSSFCPCELGAEAAPALEQLAGEHAAGSEGSSHLHLQEQAWEVVTKEEASVALELIQALLPSVLQVRCRTISWLHAALAEERTVHSQSSDYSLFHATYRFPS